MNNVAINQSSIGSASHRRLIAAGPLTKQPATLPLRVVLLANGSGFVVCDETFDVGWDHIMCAVCGVDSHQEATFCFTSHLSHDSYFGSGEFVAAAACFGDRIAASARNHYESLYRNDDHA